MTVLQGSEAKPTQSQMQAVSKLKAAEQEVKKRLEVIK
jgi:hypothetical protein